MGYNIKAMRELLFITQKVDKDDDLLGVYHEWIKVLSGQIKKISVICLYRGKVELPENVKVHSLGKEAGKSRLKYLFNFYKYIWQLRCEYDAVFVHMNPEYIFLASIFWKLSGKKIFLWYNHPQGNFFVRWAAIFADKIFYTSPFAFVSRFSKSKIMPAGINTEIFKHDPKIKKIPNSVLYVGRISPIKFIEVLIAAVKILHTEGKDFILTIVGSSSSSKDFAYEKKIHILAADLANKGKIRFVSAVPNINTVNLYNENEIVVNLTPKGSLDKTIIEAMACETLILASNISFVDILPPECLFKEKDSVDLALKLRKLLDWNSSRKEELGKRLRNYVLSRHSMVQLVKDLVKELFYE